MLLQATQLNSMSCPSPKTKHTFHWAFPSKFYAPAWAVFLLSIALCRRTSYLHSLGCELQTQIFTKGSYQCRENRKQNPTELPFNMLPYCLSTKLSKPGFHLNSIETAVQWPYYLQLEVVESSSWNVFLYHVKLLSFCPVINSEPEVCL